MVRFVKGGKGDVDLLSRKKSLEVWVEAGWAVGDVMGWMER